MAATYAAPVQELIDELGRLPGIGPKSAQRIAYYLLKRPKDDALRLSRAIQQAKDRVTFCRRCFNLADTEEGGGGVAERAECGICLDPQRDAHVICVVEEPKDVVAVERTREFKGRYHVLHGVINYVEGVGPEQLRIRELFARIGAEDTREVILCTNPTIEGEATAMWLARQLKPMGVPVSRIASGLPVGGDLEYADELTLGRALEGRRSFEG
jgi:recombination protein RecR